MIYLSYLALGFTLGFLACFYYCHKLPPGPFLIYLYNRGVKKGKEKSQDQITKLAKENILLKDQIRRLQIRLEGSKKVHATLPLES